MKKKHKLLSCFLLLILALSLISCDLLNEDFWSNNKTNEVNVMATMGTLPTLYSGLIAISSDNPSYVWYSRESTFADTDAFPSNVTILDTHSYSDIDQLREKIEMEFAEDEDTFFNFYCDDLRNHFIITLLDQVGISKENYKVTIITDGTYSYTTFNSRYAGADGYDTWEADLDDWETASAQTGEDSISDDDGQNILQYSALPYAVEYGNYINKASYFFQWPEALISEDSRVSALVSNSLYGNYGITKRTPQDILEEMTPSQIEQFRNAVGLGGDTQDTYDAYFKTADKPALIISGTSKAGESSSSNDSDRKYSFETNIEDIVNDYGDEYNIFFKPHPRWDPVEVESSYDEVYLEGRQEFLENLGITILPGMMPMESLLFLYPNIKIGGYSSSLYMSVEPEQLAFFIVDDLSELTAPLDYLVEEGYFPDTVKTYDKTRETI
ncbi:MAG: polysialyltransferase family glycosyltransferase [Sphaerochaetaceae bacterium]|nr:polysialyltransferase family glycosyltransferase [Sphaerochaetaceae bacterium]MDC7250065.1 polysialyltransferase family glycosyltransferase [Sphaerochaetaceae bacterium]